MWQSRPMAQLFRLPGAKRHDPNVATWFAADFDGLRGLARPWFERMRACGTDVGELLHDGHPTACVDEIPFGYVNAFSAHVNIGFFYGATLADPSSLLTGVGKRMRHVKLRYGQPVCEGALENLIVAAYGDVRARLEMIR